MPGKTYFELLRSWGLEGAEDYEALIEQVQVPANLPELAPKKQALAIATWSVREAWKALPPDIRDQALSVGYEVLSRVMSALEAADIDWFGSLSEKIGDTAVVGWLWEAAELLFGFFYEAIKETGKGYGNMSSADRSGFLLATMQEAAASPTDAILNTVYITNYLHYYPVDIRIKAKAWRMEPTIIPTGTHVLGDDGPAALWGTSSEVGWNPWDPGYNQGNPVPGIPGRPFKKVKAGVSGLTPTEDYYVNGSDSKWRPYPDTGSNPISMITVSALLWPWFAPQFAPRPMPVRRGVSMGMFRDSGGRIDPNVPLQAAQANLLSIWHYNLRAEGAAVRKLQQAFSKWFYAQLVATDWRATAISHIDGYPALLPGTTAIIDKERKPEMFQVVQATGEARFYAQDNRIYPYGEEEPGDWGFQGPNQYGPCDLTKNGWQCTGDIPTVVSLAQWNLVDVMTGAFFSARRRFMTPVNAQLVMEESVELWPGKMLTLDDLDPEIRDTMVALTKAPEIFEIDPDALHDTTPFDKGIGGVKFPKVDLDGGKGGIAPRPGLDGSPGPGAKKKAAESSTSLLVPLGVAAAAAAGGAGLWWYRNQAPAAPRKKRKSMAMDKQTRNILLAFGATVGAVALGFALLKPEKKPKKKTSTKKLTDADKKVLEGMGKALARVAAMRNAMEEEYALLGSPVGGNQPLWFHLAYVALSQVYPEAQWPDSPEDMEVWQQIADAGDEQKHVQALNLAKEVVPSLQPIDSFGRTQ